MNYYELGELVRFNSGRQGIIFFPRFVLFSFHGLTLPPPDVRGPSKTAGKLQSSAPASWSCIIWKWRKWRFAKIKERFTSKYEGILTVILFKKNFFVFQMICCLEWTAVQSTLLGWCLLSPFVYMHIVIHGLLKLDCFLSVYISKWVQCCPLLCKSCVLI